VKCLKAIGAILLCLSLYAALYIVCLEGDERLSWEFKPDSKTPSMEKLPAYKLGGQAVALFFMAANRIDRWFRPNAWHFDDPLPNPFGDRHFAK
jgi:hypothetical protein